MSQNISWKISADAKQALSEGAKVEAQQGRMEQGFARTARAGRQYEQELGRITVAQRLSALEMQRLRQATDTVAKTRMATWGGRDLSLSPAARAALRAGASGGFGQEAMDRAFARSLRAEELRGSRRAAMEATRSAERQSEMDILRQSLSRNRSRMERMDRQSADAKIEQEVQAAIQRKHGAKGGKRGRSSDDEFWLAAGVGGAMAMTQQVWSQMMQRDEAFKDSIGSAMTGLEREMRPLLSLGRNTDRAASIRKQVMAMSTAYGLGTGEVAQTMFNLESGTANLDPATRGQLLRATGLTTQLAGGRLDTNLNTLVKGYQIYGRELGSVERLQAKLFTTMEQGYVTQEDLANFLPNVLPVAKAFGLSFDEVAGALITATQVGGRAETTFTGLRNVISRMNEASSEGIHLTGSFAERIAQLEKVEPMKLKAIFGEEALAIISGLAAKAGELAQNIERVRAASPQTLFSKAGKAAGDPVTSAGLLRGMTDSLLANTPAMRGIDDPTIAKGDLDLKFARIGKDLSMPAIFKQLPDFVQDASLHIAANSKHLGGDWKRLGVIKSIESLRETNDPLSMALADRLSLMYGKETNRFYFDANGRKQYTGEEDATAWGKLVGEGWAGLSANEFVQYRQLQFGDPTGAAAKQYLDRVGGFVDSSSGGTTAVDQVATVMDKLNQGATIFLETMERAAKASPRPGMPRPPAGSPQRRNLGN